MAAISPFHPGEQEIQDRFGMREQIEEVGQRFIRDHLPEQHREFYAGLPFLVIGSVDEDGRPFVLLTVNRIEGSNIRGTLEHGYEIIEVARLLTPCKVFIESVLRIPMLDDYQGVSILA